MQKKRTPVRRTPAMKSGTRSPAKKSTQRTAVEEVTPIVAEVATTPAIETVAAVETVAAFPAELVVALRADSVEVAVDAAATLAELGDERVVPALVGVIENADGYCHVVTRASCAMALGRLNTPESVAALTAAVNDTMAEVSREAVLALGKLKADSVVPALCDIVANADGFYAQTVRHAAIRSLGMMQAEYARLTLEGVAGSGSESASLVETAREALAAL